jgi:intracellular septation protein A
MDTWVSYKLVGGFALTFSYIIITMVYLVKGGYMNDDNQQSKPNDV